MHLNELAPRGCFLPGLSSLDDGTRTSFFTSLASRESPLLVGDCSVRVDVALPCSRVQGELSLCVIELLAFPSSPAVPFHETAPWVVSLSDWVTSSTLLERVRSR